MLKNQLTESEQVTLASTGRSTFRPGLQWQLYRETSASSSRSCNLQQQAGNSTPQRHLITREGSVRLFEPALENSKKAGILRRSGWPPPKCPRWSPGTRSGQIPIPGPIRLESASPTERPPLQRCCSGFRVSSLPETRHISRACLSLHNESGNLR